jgi:hypothetical protein
MSADGVSLPTTISQLGSVAKTQQRAQQQGTNVTPFKDQVDRQDELHVQRVKKTEATDHRRVEREDESPDKRQRRRRRRERKLRDAADGIDDQDERTGAAEDENEKVGSLIDLRA